MVNKRGWLKLVESIFGIMIMAGVLLVVYSGQVSIVKNSDSLIESERTILRGMANDYNLREAIFNESYLDVVEFINSSLDSKENFVLLVCNLSEASCESGLVRGVRKSIYSEEIILSASSKKYEPKRARLLVWSSTGERIAKYSPVLLENDEVCTENEECLSGYCQDNIVGDDVCMDES